GEDVDRGVGDPAYDAVRHALTVHAHARVHAHDHDVELFRVLVGELESAGAQDVDLHPPDDPDAFGLLPHGLDLRRLPPRSRHDPLPLLLRARHGHAVGGAGGPAVVGDGHVPVAPLLAGPGHGLDGVLAVAPGGVHLEVAADVVELDELREPALPRGLDLTAV